MEPSLPLELWELIFRNLSFTDLVSLSLTNKTFNFLFKTANPYSFSKKLLDPIKELAPFSLGKITWFQDLSKYRYYPEKDKFHLFLNDDYLVYENGIYFGKNEDILYTWDPEAKVGYQLDKKHNLTRRNVDTREREIFKIQNEEINWSKIKNLDNFIKTEELDLLLLLQENNSGSRYYQYDEENSIKWKKIYEQRFSRTIIFTYGPEGIDENNLNLSARSKEIYHKLGIHLEKRLTSLTITKYNYFFGITYNKISYLEFYPDGNYKIYRETEEESQ